MYISQLRSKIEGYDRFGEHRVNGLKALFVLELLFGFNLIYGVPHPYFYFFYIPLTAFAAEIAGYTLRDKYVFFIFTMLGSILAVWAFGVFSVYKTFFVFFVFFYSLWLYLTAVYFLKSMLVPAPLILSLATYSLIYGTTDANFYISLNHALQTIVAMLIVLAGLLFFPKSYYLRIWRRAFIVMLTDLEAISYQLYHEECRNVPIVTGLVVMERYSQMLSRRIGWFSVLRITLLSNELVMAMSYLFAFKGQVRLEYIGLLHKYFGRLRLACHGRCRLSIDAADLTSFQETYELRSLQNLISSWNALCLK